MEFFIVVNDSKMENSFNFLILKPSLKLTSFILITKTVKASAFRIFILEKFASFYEMF